MALFARTLSNAVSRYVLPKYDAILSSQLQAIQTRSLPIVWSSTTWHQEFYNSKTDLVDESEERTKYLESKEDFKYVERLIPSLEVPEPPKHDSYPTPSGWSPPKGSPEGLPYHVRRTRYHSHPVSIQQKHGGNQIWTIVKNVDGDIWTFGNKLLEHLEEVKGAEVGMTINEYAKRVFYKGVFKDDVIKWLENEGF
ncbi:putative 39S ribosomal protein L49, mitochondrial [Apostichopus japonicus]|uniref:Large ribosomal subunit protein mL49 n=1 Tax=Stichopus japonicus TaxID=307972 RepID=A0A2G8L4M2_STIJA|nr:putative 39S ribosomal protein L49, mitochondrial [Apostichopus japonicus]